MGLYERYANGYSERDCLVAPRDGREGGADSRLYLVRGAWHLAAGRANRDLLDVCILP